ncbi:unnamed protein product [Zymoseptoria tritici ST99CH_1A5]|uniref:Rhodopsin domain-containing protein n=1 Tax=Zymoseptoria tritici ST99CH_1A5 TaxID=1276529 RepID=A0A1Y6LU78_ZYMTR|nr:unnamed protein product [Zymoseptoria tritici ST99CH_1A5]
MRSKKDNVLHLDITIPQPWVPEFRWINVYTATLYAAATLMVLQRLLLRAFRFGSPLGLDDILIFAAWLAATAFYIECTLALTSLDYGVAVQPPKFEFIALMLWCIELACVVCQGFTKLAVLAILNRFVKATSDTRIRYAIYGAAALTVGAALSMAILCFAICQPFDGFWRAFDPDYPREVRCVNKKAAAIVAGVFAVVSDLYTVAIPWAISRSFGLNKRQTLALNLVFMIGLIVTVASGVRTYHLYEVYRANRVSHNLAYCIIWATVELQVAICCACLPSLRVLYRLIVGSKLSRKVHQRYFSRPGDSYLSRSGDLSGSVSGHTINTTEMDDKSPLGESPPWSETRSIN